MADKHADSGARSTPRRGDDFDISAPRNIVALVVVETVALVVSRTYGGMYLYGGLAAVALMKPVLAAVVGLALCVVDIADLTAVTVVLGGAYVCRSVVTRVEARGSDEVGLSADDLARFTGALEFRSGEWFVDHAQLDEGLVGRLTDRSLIYPLPVRQDRGVGTDGRKLFQLTRRGIRLARRRLVTADVPDSDRLWNLSSGSSMPVYVFSLLAVAALLFGWRSVPDTVEVGRVAASLGQDLDAKVSADEFATAAFSISRAPDARALYRPLACRLFLARDDDLAIRTLQSLLLANGSFSQFRAWCPRLPEHVEVIDLRFDIIYFENSRGEEVSTRAAPLLERMSPDTQLVGALRMAACLNDERGDRLTAAYQMTMARAFQAAKGIATSEELEDICPAPTTGYTETGTGTDIVVQARDHEQRTERTFE